MVIGFHVAYFDFSVLSFFRILLLLSLIGFAVECRRKNIGVVKDYVLGNSIGLWIVLPQLFISGQKNCTNLILSLGNEDISYYHTTASHLLQSGFVNQGVVNLNDLNLAALNHPYFTPTPVFAFERSNSPIWSGQFATPTMIVFITFGALIVSKSSKMIAPPN